VTSRAFTPPARSPQHDEVITPFSEANLFKKLDRRFELAVAQKRVAVYGQIIRPNLGSGDFSMAVIEHASKSLLAADLDP